MNENAGYYWVRVFDFDKDRDNEYGDKGIMLDEFYLKDVQSREAAKTIVKEKYSGKTSQNLMFAKPKNKTGVYAIVMDSDKFFYDRFMVELDTFCFNPECHKKINGKLRNFPSSTISDENDFEKTVTVHFCGYDCKNKVWNLLRGSEGEFQEREVGENGNIIGYIYHMYNRIENTHYVGQTKYLPFFRWQEHIKSGQKGSIEDLVFDVLATVKKKHSKSINENQQVLNSVEAWWIAKFKEEGCNVFNISNPKITCKELVEKYNDMVKINCQTELMLEFK